MLVLSEEPMPSLRHNSSSKTTSTEKLTLALRIFNFQVVVVTFSIYPRHTIPSRSLKFHSTVKPFGPFLITDSMRAFPCLYPQCLHSLHCPIWSNDFSCNLLFIHKALAILFCFLKTSNSFPPHDLCIHCSFCVKVSAPSSLLGWQLLIIYILGLNALSQRSCPWPKAGPSAYITQFCFLQNPYKYMDISCLFAYLLIVCLPNLPTPLHVYCSLLRG